MPDVSMVQQGALNRSTPLGSRLDMTQLNGACTPRLGISKSQVVQFLNIGDVGVVFECLATPSYNLTPLVDPCPTEDSGLRQTPVMHPNLVCTLKSILSPKSGFDTEHAFTSSDGDSSRCTPFGSSPISEMPEVQTFEERITSLAGSPEITSWSNKQVVPPEKPKLLRQEAVLVPVDLIQNRRPYQCAFTGCQRTFKNPQTMRMHHKTHFTDAAAAAAAAAGTSTLVGGEAVGGTQGLSLKAGHNKKIPSQCPTCYKTFVGLYELRRHFGRKHSEGEKRHACTKCGKRFHIEVDVRDHEKLCGEPIVCTCGMKFAFKCNLVAHKRSHPKCQDNAVTPTSPEHQRKRRKLSEALVESPVKGAEIVPQLSPVQPFAILDSASASSSPFSSATSSPSTSFVAEALPDFDVTSGSSCLDYLSSRLFQADSYIKFPLDNCFLAYQAVPQDVLRSPVFD